MTHYADTCSDVGELKEIFLHHTRILKSYSDLKIPKHVLKEMAKELEDFYEKANRKKTDQQ
ncbi:MAG: hypothetical protein KIT80_07330 [Chitinophagaceae bacterium]|nr:hypothetical protein [Chitinophagaceae bacterium]MCW5926703.1 hypothetical protein [Chitinophagaceae bacterium]